MQKVIKKTAKHSAIYGFGRISNRLVGFLLLPVYTSKISIEDYGIYAILEIFTQLSIILLTFGLNSSLFRWMNIDKDKKYRGSIIFTTLTILISISIVLFFIGNYFKRPISIVLIGDTVHQDLFYYVFLIISIGIVKFVLFNLIRVYEKSIFFSIISVVSLAINLSLNIYLIFYQNMGIEGILIASTLSSAFSTICLLLFFLKHIYIKLNIKAFWSMLTFGFPIIFSSIFGFIINMSDRYIINIFLPMEYVGKYTFVYKIGSTVNIFLIQSFLMAWPAIAWENIRKSKPEEFISKMTTYFTFITMWFVLGLSVFSKPLIFFVSKNPDYNEAYSLVPLIAFSFIFTGLYHILGFPLHFKRKTKHFIQIAGIASFINLGLNFSLIPYFGLIVPATSTLISFFIMSALSLHFSRKYFNLIIESGRLVKIFLTGFLLYFLTYVTEIFNFDSIIVSFLSIILYPIILFRVNFFNKKETEWIKLYYQKIKLQINR